MINHNFKSSYFSKKTYVHFILPILFTIIISIFLAQFTVSIQLQNNDSISLFDSANEFFITLNIFFIILISMASLFIFFSFI